MSQSLQKAIDSLCKSRNAVVFCDHTSGYQGKYQVIFLTFKDVKYDSWESTFAKISGLLQEEFGRHSELRTSNKLETYEKDYFEKIMDGRSN